MEIIYNGDDAPIIGVTYMGFILINSEMFILSSNTFKEPSFIKIMGIYGIILTMKIGILIGIKLVKERFY